MKHKFEIENLKYTNNLLEKNNFCQQQESSVTRPLLANKSTSKINTKIGKNMLSSKSGSRNDVRTNRDRPSSCSTLKVGIGISLTVHSDECKKKRNNSESNLSMIKTDELNLALKNNHITTRSRNISTSEIAKRKSIFFVSSPMKRGIKSVRELRKNFSPNNTPAKCKYFLNSSFTYIRKYY